MQHSGSYGIAFTHLHKGGMYYARITRRGKESKRLLAEVLSGAAFGCVRPSWRRPSATVQSV
jgi:hypothetical protein